MIGGFLLLAIISLLIGNNYSDQNDISINSNTEVTTLSTETPNVSTNSSVTQNEKLKSNDNIEDNKPIATSIKISSLMVKRINGKFKYWFDIRNLGKNPFNGIVKIWCITDDENAEFDEIFQTNRPIEPKLGTSQFIELNTGTIIYDGANGISKFRYEVVINDNVVQSGQGRITDKFEDLD